MFEDGLRYQDARMASEDEMKRDLYGFHINDSRRIPKGGPILFRESDMAYVDPSEVHSLIVGDTGSMKTLRFVLPLIYSCAKAGESMVIVDPKGELVRKQKAFCRKPDMLCLSLICVDLRIHRTSGILWDVWKNPLLRENPVSRRRFWN